MPYFDLILLHILYIISAYTDVKDRKLYNWVTLPFIFIGVINTICLYGLEDGLFEIFLIIPLFLICFLLFKLHQIGGGDAKLIIATSAIMGITYTLFLILISFIMSWFYIFAIYLKTKKKKITEKVKITVPLGPMMLLGLLILDIYTLIS